MRKESQVRYSDQELLDMLETAVFDYGKAPSQRIILADKRMPTHHTYNNRLGSVKEALEMIGFDEIGDNYAYHVILGDMIKKLGGEIIKERPRMGNTKSIRYIIANYYFSLAGRYFYVDLVGVAGVNRDITLRNRERRILVAERYIRDRSNTEYIAVSDAIDIVQAMENIRHTSSKQERMI